jgi:hypothetical protein
MLKPMCIKYAFTRVRSGCYSSLPMKAHTYARSHHNAHVQEKYEYTGVLIRD